MASPANRSRARRSLSSLAATAVLGTMLVIPGATVSAVEPTDMVLDWNEYALNAIGNANVTTPPVQPGLATNPPASGLLLAMVHGAIYDAVNAIDGTHKPYRATINAPAGASQAAAAATAAHHVLVALTPASLPQVKESLDGLYEDSLDDIPDGKAETDGISVGAAAATAMLNARTGDGRNGTRTFPIGTHAGEWRPVPPGNGNAFSWVGDVKPFALISADQLRTEGPPALDSAQYTAEFNEVKALGAKTGSSRNEAQNILANFIVANPLPMVNAAFRDLAREHHLSTAQQARLFGMSSLSVADAFIACWNNKNEHLFWRPQTAIQLAADDGNPDTTADGSWQSLFATPGYPDSPSGYNCFAAAMMHSGIAFFGTDKVEFDLRGPTTRSYTRFTDYVRDAIEGRILTGFHFRHADVQGAWIGKKAAQWVDKHEFGPAG